MNSLLKLTVEHQASDLHLIAGVPPHLRINGRLIKLDMPSIVPDELRGLLYSILNTEQIKTLEENLELDFSHSIWGISRFRGNILYQRSTLGAVLRVVPFEIPSFESLGLPKKIKDLCRRT